MTYPNMGSIRGSVGVPYMGGPGAAETARDPDNNPQEVADMTNDTQLAAREKRGR